MTKEKTMNLLKRDGQTNRVTQFVDYSKASPETINRVLNALNSELTDALQEKRRPLLDNVFERLGNFPKTLM
jgi:hypothetical protein